MATLVLTHYHCSLPMYQQASELAHKDAGGFRLDSQVHIREGFKPNLAPLARPSAQPFSVQGIMLNND